MFYEELPVGHADEGGRSAFSFGREREDLAYSKMTLWPLEVAGVSTGCVCSGLVVQREVCSVVCPSVRAKSGTVSTLNFRGVDLPSLT